MNKILIAATKDTFDKLGFNEQKGEKLLFDGLLITDYKFTQTSYGVNIEGLVDYKRIKIRTNSYCIQIQENIIIE